MITIKLISPYITRCIKTNLSSIEYIDSIYNLLEMLYKGIKMEVLLEYYIDENNTNVTYNIIFKDLLPITINHIYEFIRYRLLINHYLIR